MFWLLLSSVLAQEPAEIINGIPIYHSKGVSKIYRHILLTLTPTNCLLPNDPKIVKHLGLSNQNQNYRKHILDEKSDNFTTGQFQVYIPVSKFPLVNHKKGYMILRMPSTLADNKESYISEKQELYFRIQKMMKEQKGTVDVVVELPEPIRRNLFFRDAGGRYVDYIGQFKR